MHEVLVNRLAGLSLPRKSVVRLTDRPDMTLDVYRGRKTTIQHFFNFSKVKFLGFCFNITPVFFYLCIYSFIFVLVKHNFEIIKIEMNQFVYFLLILMYVVQCYFYSHYYAKTNLS